VTACSSCCEVRYRVPAILPVRIRPAPRAEL